MYEIKDTGVLLVGAYCMWDRKAILVGEEMGRVLSLLDFEQVIRTRVFYISAAYLNYVRYNGEADLLC